MSHKKGFPFVLCLIVIMIWFLPQICFGEPMDTRYNYFYPGLSYDQAPPSSYGNWVYTFQQWEWLGTYKTSASASGVGVGADDGISFGSLAAGSINTLTYTIKTGPYTGIENFYVWADWNDNGNWLDAGELIVDLDLSVSANSILTDTISFLIPAYYNSNLVGGDLWFNAVVSPNIVGQGNTTAGISSSWLRGEQEAFKVNVSPVPEPTTILLLSTGLCGLLGIGIKCRRRKRS